MFATGNGWSVETTDRADARTALQTPLRPGKRRRCASPATAVADNGGGAVPPSQEQARRAVDAAKKRARPELARPEDWQRRRYHQKAHLWQLGSTVRHGVAFFFFCALNPLTRQRRRVTPAPTHLPAWCAGNRPTGDCLLVECFSAGRGCCARSRDAPDQVQRGRHAGVHRPLRGSGAARLSVSDAPPCCRVAVLACCLSAMPPCHYHNRRAAAACDDLVVCALTSDEVWRFTAVGTLETWLCPGAVAPPPTALALRFCTHPPTPMPTPTCAPFAPRHRRRV